MALTTIFIIAISVFAAIGAVIGIFKKATGLPFWGATVLLSVLVSWLVDMLVPADNGAYSWLVLGITVGSAVLFTLFFGGVKKFLQKRIDNAKEYSHYKNTDKLEENKEYVLNAVDGNDKKQYRKLRKKRRKIKDSSGGWGVVNRLLGFIFGGVEWLVAVGSIVCMLLLFVEFSGITALQELSFVQEMLATAAWVDIGSKFAIDMLLVGTIVIALKVGFNRGIFHYVTVLVVLAMLGGFGYASWAIATSVDCSGLQTGLLSQLNDINPDAAAIVAQVIVAAIIFLLSLIIVIITGILLPKLINKYRDNDAFYVADGILGAVVSVAILLAVYIALGGIAYTLNDLSFMSKFNAYEAQSTFANTFYALNPVQSWFANVPIRSWFGN